MQPQAAPGHGLLVVPAVRPTYRRPHAVLHGQGTDLELLAFRLVGFLVASSGTAPACLAKAKIGVAGG